MKSILPCSREVFAVELRRKKRICVIVAAVTVLANLLLCFLRTDENARIFKWINILLDTIGCWFLFGFVSLQIRPAQKIYSLAMRADKSGVRICGTVRSISDKAEHNAGLPCKEVQILGKTIRKVYLPEMLALHTGDEVQLLLCDNIVVEVK